MRILLIVIAISSSIRLLASPAATQDWVRDYVETNTTGMATEEWVREYVADTCATKDWVINYISTNIAALTSKSTIMSSNSLVGIVSSFSASRATSLSSCTNDAYASISNITNLNKIVLAPIEDDLYTNAIAGVYMTFTGGVFDLHDGAVSYVSSTNFNKVISLTCETNGVVKIYESKFTNEDIRKAKGE